MTRDRTNPLLNRHTRISDLARSVRRLLGRSLLPLGIVLAIEATILWFADHPGTNCFALVAISSLVGFAVWQRHGVGLPVVPLLALQNLIAYGLPIVVENETVMKYSGAQMTSAGFEVFVFGCSVCASWWVGIRMIAPSSSECYALQGINDAKMDRLARVALSLAGAATAYVVLRSLGLLNTLLGALPEGSYSIITALVSAVSACGFFLGSMILGRGGMSRLQRSTFWLMLATSCIISSTSLLLSGSAILIVSVLVGLFWSTGRLPWRYLLVVSSLLAFCNLGKFEMRERYWPTDDQDTPTTVEFGDIPSFYREWSVASFDAITGAERLDSGRASSTGFRSRTREIKVGQSLLDRVDNLQNVLFVVNAVETNHVPPVGGATYALIPPLLLPRIIWPEKPRTHAGQVLLNVHFGRQDLNSTFQTYIAWGLIAEAYGNFGPFFGNLIVGAVLGLLLAWLEQYIAAKLLLSLEGLLAFALLLGIANSFEMVASVLVTSLFQSFVPIIVACSPFVKYSMPPGQPGNDR